MCHCGQVRHLQNGCSWCIIFICANLLLVTAKNWASRLRDKTRSTPKLQTYIFRGNVTLSSTGWNPIVWSDLHYYYYINISLSSVKLLWLLPIIIHTVMTYFAYCILCVFKVLPNVFVSVALHFCNGWKLLGKLRVSSIPFLGFP